MTIRMYSQFKKIDLGRVSVDVFHNKIHAKDCEDCAQDVRQSNSKIDVFRREIHVEELEDQELHAKILEIADKCPVHRTLEKGALVHTTVAGT